MTQLAIYNALIAHLDTFAYSPELPIVSNREEGHTPIIGEGYIVGQWLPAPTESFTIGRENNVYQGIQQVTVVWPKDDEAGAVGVADAIVAHFRKGTRIDGDGVRLKIFRQPYQATPASDDNVWLRVPVSIPYQCVK